VGTISLVDDKLNFFLDDAIYGYIYEKDQSKILKFEQVYISAKFITYIELPTMNVEKTMITQFSKMKARTLKNSKSSMSAAIESKLK